jgi:hypothetical protein
VARDAPFDAAMIRRRPGLGLMGTESAVEMTTLSTGFATNSLTFDVASQHSCHDTPGNLCGKRR